VPTRGGETLTAPGPDMRELVGRLAPHPATQLGLELASEAGRAAWWVAALVLAGAAGEAQGLAAARGLLDAGLASPDAVARAAPQVLAAALAVLGERRAGAVASRLLRASRALAQGSDGALEPLERSCEGLEELGSRLARLAPGIGASAVLRFLRPLRDVWPSAAETPLAPAARAAALHLGWIGEAEDEEGAPGALHRHWQETAGAPPFRDVEAALERLGSRACLRGHVRRCPLGSACPAR
jgi:hypothetical protein